MLPPIPDSLFSGLEIAPQDEAFALTAAFNNNSSTEKVNLGIGVYRDDRGMSWRLPVVRKVCELDCLSCCFAETYIALIPD
jgi:aspartate/tyrosine/aromatic aminotransferase